MEANMSIRMENKSSKAYSRRMIGAVTPVAVLLIVAIYVLAVQFPINPDQLATFAFPPEDLRMSRLLRFCQPSE
jgi:hypothetical protein